MLDRKLNDQKKHQMIYILSKECMAERFYKHICKDENFLYPNGKNDLQSKVSEIMTDFLKEKKEILSWETIYHSTKIFFTTCILMHFMRFTARPKGEVSTLRALSTSCSNLQGQKEHWILRKNPPKLWECPQRDRCLWTKNQ